MNNIRKTHHAHFSRVNIPGYCIIYIRFYCLFSILKGTKWRNTIFNELFYSFDSFIVITRKECPPPGQIITAALLAVFLSGKKNVSVVPVTLDVILPFSEGHEFYKILLFCIKQMIPEIFWNQCHFCHNQRYSPADADAEPSPLVHGPRDFSGDRYGSARERFKPGG